MNAIFKNRSIPEKNDMHQVLTKQFIHISLSANSFCEALKQIAKKNMHSLQVNTRITISDNGEIQINILLSYVKEQVAHQVQSKLCTFVS